jgi:F-type H+-transporting ATPase subunit b
MKRFLLIAAITCCTLAAQESGAEQKEEGDKYAVWKWANFAILAVALGYLASKHLPAFFAARTSEIQKGIAEAQQMKRDAEQRAAAMDARMSALGAEVEKLRAASQAEMQQESERIRAETAAEMKKLEEHTALEIESAGKTARRQLREYAADLALELAEKRVRARLDGATEAALVENFVNDLARQGSKN